MLNFVHEGPDTAFALPSGRHVLEEIIIDACLVVSIEQSSLGASSFVKPLTTQRRSLNDQHLSAKPALASDNQALPRILVHSLFLLLFVLPAAITF
jgi:hypothetical protein